MHKIVYLLAQSLQIRNSEIPEYIHQVSNASRGFILHIFSIIVFIDICNYNMKNDSRKWGIFTNTIFKLYIEG